MIVIREFVLLVGMIDEKPTYQIVIFDPNDPEEEDDTTCYSYNISPDGEEFEKICPPDRKMDEWDYANWGWLTWGNKARILSLVCEVELEPAKSIAQSVSVSKGFSDYVWHSFDIDDVLLSIGGEEFKEDLRRIG